MQRQAVAKVQKSPVSGLPKQSTRPSPATHSLIGLQRSIGNRAVQRLINSPYIQTKLRVSMPGDQSEREADRVANTVMRIPEPQPEVMEENEESKSLQAKPPELTINRLLQPAPQQLVQEENEELVATKPLVQRVPLAVRENENEETVATKLHRHASGGVIQRLCTECEEEKEKQTGAMVQRQAAAVPLPDEDQAEEQEVQAKADESSSPNSTTSLAENIHAMNGGGSPLPDTTRAFFEPRFGADFNHVRVHTDSQAAETANSIDARAFTVGRDIVFGSGQYVPGSTEGQHLLAHELAHTLQQAQTTSGPSFITPLSRLMIMRGKGKAAKSVVGWIVKVGERKLIKKLAIYNEKELTKLLGKGYNVLVKRGSSQAKRIAKKVWGENVIHHTGHIIRATGKKGLSHFQPARHLVGRAGEKGWHVFYSAIPIIFFAEDVEAMEVYEDKYPGESIANYLTVTKYVGEDSWLSYLDWINPGELVAIGGDIGRDWDRERTKELKALVFNRVTADGSVQTYELDPEGQLVRVIIVSKDGKQKTLTADEYFTFLGGISDQPLPAQDGTKSPHYASTFDADYRIYNSKENWAFDSATLSFYLPADEAKKLERVGEFYVMEDTSKSYIYAYVHPRHRAVLKSPGFLVPASEWWSYFMSPEETLHEMLTMKLHATKMREADLWQAK